MLLEPADIRPFVKVPELLSDEKAQHMIDSAESRARLLAPCLADLTDDPRVRSDLTEDQVNVVRDILSTAIVRWADGGRGVVQTEAKGEYSQTIGGVRRGEGLFRPNEIRELQDICKGARRGRASTIATWLGLDTPAPTVHPFITDNEGEYW